MGVNLGHIFRNLDLNEITRVAFRGNRGKFRPFKKKIDRFRPNRVYEETNLSGTDLALEYTHTSVYKSIVTRIWKNYPTFSGFSVTIGGLGDTKRTVRDTIVPT